MNKVQKLLINSYNVKNIDNIKISKDVISILELLCSRADEIKGIISVLLTSACYKTLYPNQDIRYHQKQLKNGYSGRSFDTKYIVPFCKEKGLSCPKESGWLTRSLEQPYPYTHNYKGRIRSFKKEFLNIIEAIENTNPKNILTIMFYFLKQNKKDNLINYDKIKQISISHLISKILNIRTKGVSKIPVHIIKILEEIASNTTMNLDSHYASDNNSNTLGDIYNPSTNINFEIKHNILFDQNIQIDIINKIKNSDLKIRKYIFISTHSNQKNDHFILNIDDLNLNLLVLNLHTYISYVLFEHNISSELFFSKLLDNLKNDSEISNKLYSEFIKLL